MKTQRIEEKSGPSVTESSTWLVRIGCASDPLSAPAIVPLDGKTRLVLGRRDSDRLPEAGRFESADPWMSGDHVALERSEDGWELQDLGSSNGTLIFGQRRTLSGLADGDLFETGGTFWIFHHQPGEVPGPIAPGPLGSISPAFLAVTERLRRIARTKVPVLIEGATGTGKEVLARSLHELSGREGPFLAINTAAIQTTLVAAELFGVERGAHSLAERARPGQVRAADKGTLLLDEIGDMPLEVQASLLRVLQESEVLPVGGDVPIKVDVRFVCATHQDLPQLVQSGRFRADLYARLKGTVLEVPSLVDRPEDIGVLITRILDKLGASDVVLTPAAYRALILYRWPLNVRELEKALETALALCERGRIELEHFPQEVQEALPTPSRPPEAVDGQSRQQELLRLLELHRGNVTAVARSMGYSRVMVHRWLKQMQIDPATFRSS
jgi:DNA-binding NtrC family response regulator